jgi:peptidoglycan/xylan/chitin deacetylase (PgdA/CDA1 family)
MKKITICLTRLFHFTVGLISALRFHRRLKTPQRFDIRVFVYHDVATDELLKMKKQIVEIAKTRRIITPDEFEKICSTRAELSENLALLTFDDGFESNFMAAQQILNPMEIKAIFFVVLDFMKLTDEKSMEMFIRNRINRDTSKRKCITSNRCMSLEQVTTLIDQGHEVGSHTFSHPVLSEITNVKELNYEIVGSGEELERILRKNIKHFAFTFGNIESISANALYIARRYQFVHTSLRGANQIQESRVIYRETIHPWNTIQFVRGCSYGCLDWQYKKKRRILDYYSMYN